MSGAPLAIPDPNPRVRRIALLGVGTVGRALLARLQALDDPRLLLCLAANSRQRAFAAEGLDPAALAAQFAQGETHDGSGALPGAFGAGDIVVDATASAELAGWHPRWLRQGLHVVSANKLGLGGPLLRQHEIRALATRHEGKILAAPPTRLAGFIKALLSAKPRRL